MHSETNLNRRSHTRHSPKPLSKASSSLALEYPSESAVGDWTEFVGNRIVIFGMDESLQLLNREEKQVFKRRKKEEIGNFNLRLNKTFF